jgi:hypothetical protein
MGCIGGRFGDNHNDRDCMSSVWLQGSRLGEERDDGGWRLQETLPLSKMQQHLGEKGLNIVCFVPK